MLHNDPPVRPWFTGSRVPDPVTRTRVTMGSEHLVAASTDLLRTGRPLAVDIETFGLGLLAERIKAVGVGTTDSVVIFDPRDPGQAKTLRWLLSEAPLLVFHNSSFDVPNLVRNGLLSTEAVNRIVDTLIYARLAFPSRKVGKSLTDLAVKLLGLTKQNDPMALAFKMEGLTKTAGYAKFDIDRPIYVIGLMQDVWATASLHPILVEAAINQTTRHPYTDYGVNGTGLADLLEREQRINRIFLRRSSLGLRVDFDFLDEFNRRYERELATTGELLSGYGIKAGDSASMAAWCADNGFIGPGWPTLKSGKPSGDKKRLERVPHDLVKLFIKHKERTKVLRDYLVTLQDSADTDGRIHPSVAIFGACTTGRMSISGPPLQQFPAEARGMLMAEPGEKFTSIDWSQIEPVVAANLANDEAVLGDYESENYKPGTGVYDTVAAFAGITRKQAKVVILADMYGQGIPLLSSNLGCDPDTARAIKDRVHAAMPVLRQHLERVKRAAAQNQCVPTLSGRILPVEKDVDDEGRWRVKDYMGVNYHIQGSAYDVLADTLIRVEDAGLADAVTLAMHDELIVETGAAADIQKIMETPTEALVARSGRVPILHTDRKDLGERWAYA